MMSDASEMLAAALEQMDGIIAGSKAMDYSNGLFDCQSPTSPFLGSLRALHLLEDLRAALEMMDQDEREGLRCQVPDTTADGLVEWLQQGQLTNGNGSAMIYQERLSRVESDKECLELLSRSTLETQKLELMTEVSSLKLKLTTVARDLRDSEVHGCIMELYQEVNDLRFRVTDMENERLQCEKKLKSTKVSSMAKNLSAIRRPWVNPFKLDCDRRIEELQESITRYKKVQDLVKGETMFKEYETSNEVFYRYHYNSPFLFIGLDQSRFRTTVEEPSPPSNPSSNESFGTKKARSSFGRGFFKMRGGKRTSSAPNLAETERKGTDHLDLAGAPPHKPQGGDSSQTLPSSPEAKKKSKGFMKFLGRLKRSHSTSLDPEETEFRRGGVRATAGPRLGWSRDLQHSADDVDAPFAQWSKEQVCVWLQEQGLGLHVAQAQQWIRSGFTLLQASQHDLEKELGIKQPLHRKKLQLALQALGSEEDVSKAKLDHNWVTRWLDDIGLPQYKSQFDEGRVDGRMLHYMTVDDLLSLKVGSVLHHLSIKRAIQVLRLNFYEPNCLRRRPSDENNITPGEISQWTNHRVMEWLRSVDLAEYAPNLRGSGVHGGVMVLEPRFNVESLALLLNIPPNKTLLRRHLATHFHLLIGSAAQRSKQECLENPDYTLLTATAKVKPRRLPFGGFGTLRKKRQEDSEEYVCPMDVEMPKNSSFQGDLRIYEDNLDQMEDSEGAVRQIGAFSEEIDNLTVRSH
uniref:SAM domain-containing protein n=1 Tax=Oncorhynchus mykiss TaxID=8022 RepID=A0A8C7Q8W8_ONCMY